MSLLTSTITYMILSILFVALTDYLFYKYDVKDYKVFTEKMRFIFMMTMLSIMLLFYTLVSSNPYLPLIIIGLVLSVVWVWFFIMDTDLKLLRWYEKIILLSITLISFLAIYYSIEYIISIGLTKLLRIDLCDNSNDCEECYGECCTNDEILYVNNHLDKDEARKVIDQYLFKYDEDQHYDYDDMRTDIINHFGGEVKPSDIYDKLDFDIRNP